jgi:hypothetical protein
MSLSRLQNFLNNPTGTTIFVDPNNFDATDSIENRGTSPGRPFFSIMRGILESARYSFSVGRNNDLNDRTTIMVAPGTHYIDNRPGYSVENINGSAVYKKRTGRDTWTETVLQPLGENSNFDIFDPNNDLYKFNSVNGGLILPRGTSIVGQDLRKTKIRPLYVPDPMDENIERSSILNVTGSCYFTSFTFFDADPTKFSYRNYSDTKHVPKYSHHKLTTFVYADGVNPVRLGATQTNLTDLDMFYYKLTTAYGPLSGRGLEDFPANLDFEPNINEFRIVGALQENPLGISSIRAGNGDGTGDNSVVTITTANLQSKIEEPHNFAVDTPIIIRGITQSPGAYNGSFTVREVVGVNTFTYVTSVIPSEVLPASSTFEVATVSVESDTVSSASPYIFNCSLRSVFGLCGMWADGTKASGFKSMVVAQFTGISLQKDNDAYLIYDNGIFYDDITLPDASPLRPLYQNSRAIFKPEFENFHIRASGDAFIQVVSVFAIGYSKHFVTESGADMSITNSNSNFGANALTSIGFKKVSFDRDDTGIITHIIPPRELSSTQSDVTWLSLDIGKTQSISNPTRLYINGYTKNEIVPPHQVDGFRIGAKDDDELYLTITGSTGQETYSTPIFMSTPTGVEGFIAKKEYNVTRTGTINNISTSGVLTLNVNHQLYNGEKVRIFSNTGQAPDKLQIDKIYYTITSQVDPTLGPNQIKLAFSLSDAISGLQLSGLNNNGGIISVLSTVTDKRPGELGHPVQWDEAASNWYINTSSAMDNGIYDVISSINIATFGNESPTTFVRRVSETRPIDERLYKIRYVIPKEYINAKEPQVGFIIQESKNVAISTLSINEGSALLNSTELRNDKVIVTATTGAIANNRQTVTATTELPHSFISGDIIKIQNIRSTNNTAGVGIVSTYNGEYQVQTTPTSRTFTYRLEGRQTNPGTFTNNINQRATRQQRDALPIVARQSFKNNFYIYRVDPIRTHIPGSEGQDGVYHLTVLSSSIGIRDTVGYGLSEKYFNQDIRNLYPQIDRDNAISNPVAAVSYADLSTVGKVITDDKKKSITLEVINELNKNTKVGFGITNITLSGVGNTTVTLFTNVEHKLNSIRDVNFVTTGAGYPINSTFFSRNLLDLLFGEEDATCKYTTTSGGNVDPNTFSLVDVGAAHTVGERLGVQGGTISNAIVEVNEINNNLGDGLELSGFINTSELNGLYEIINVPNKRTVSIYVPEGISEYNVNTNSNLPVGYIASKGVGITSITLSDLKAGIATVTSNYPHGLFTGNKFKFTNSNLDFYNKDFVVAGVVGINTFTFNVGLASTTNTPTTGRILKYGISSNALNLGRGEENLASRACLIYSGLTVLLTTELTTSSTTINVDNSNGIKRGDFININGEILRVSTVPTSNTFNVLRSQLGTIRTTAASGSVVKKIKTLPVETRRPSFMRASGHTFEYLGFGPGNYSTALPQRQDRVLDEVEVLISQAKKQSAGTIVYTGMNDLGEFYTGSKKISSTTGAETIVEAPILTFTGDDVDGTPQGRQSGVFDEVLVRNRITVEGGDNNDQSSQFYGPVTFNKRITNLSDDGILIKNLYLRGSASQEKLITVGISTPTLEIIPSPRSGHISFISDPSNPDINYIGHIYKTGEWRQFGLISNEPNELSFTVDKLGIGEDPDDTFRFKVLGAAQFQNLEITNGLIVRGGTTLADVTFENINIFGTATFLGFNPVSGLSTNYTQIHERGTSLFNQVEAVGISTFYNDVYVTKAPNIGGIVPTLYPDRIQLPNIRVGIANSNTIDTRFGDLVLSANSNRTTINTNVSINSGNIAITSTRSSGIATAYIENSSSIRLGVGNTNQQSFIEFNNDTSTFPDFGLRLIRNAGSGNQSSTLVHRGTEPLFISAFNNADVRIISNNIERVRVGSSGTITVYQNNSGEDLTGGHLRLTQAGAGDVAISWDITRNNANRRWYAGIDVSDNFAWKLAAPLTNLQYGNENFNSDTKIRVDVNGDLRFTTSTGIATVNATNIISSSNGIFNLLNTNISSANIFGDAETINIAKVTNISRVNIRGTTQSTSTSTGALVVSGGLGIDKNTFIGGSLLVEENITLKGSNTGNLNLFRIQNNSGTDRFTVDSTTGNTIISGITTVTGDTRLNSTLGVTGATTLTGLLDANGGATIDNVRIGIAGDNEIDTAPGTGNLILDSAGGTVEIQDNLTVSGIATFSGNVDFGNATSDTITFTSRIDSNVLPAINALSSTDVNGKDLGGTSNYWRSIYAREFVGAIDGNAATATLAANLNRSVIAGNGLIGGGVLNNQNVTLNVVGGIGGGITVSADAIAVDSTVVRTTGNQTLDGIKTFNSTISGSISGNSETSSLAANLNRSVIAGNGLTGGGLLNNQDVTLNIVGGDGITISVDSIALDASVVRTTGNQSIGGEKTFTSILRCNSDIIAFASDERLKENIQPLDNALDKVLALSGFTYNFNEIGKSLGFDTTITYVGVSAQEVQVVLPEAVKPAPADPNYITVQYEKIVPLLIEAIKELKAEINELKGVK